MSVPVLVAGYQTDAEKSCRLRVRRVTLVAPTTKGPGGANSFCSFCGERGSENTSSCSISTADATGARLSSWPGAPRSATDQTFELLSMSEPQTHGHAAASFLR